MHVHKSIRAKLMSTENMRILNYAVYSDCKSYVLSVYTYTYLKFKFTYTSKVQCVSFYKILNNKCVSHTSNKSHNKSF